MLLIPYGGCNVAAGATAQAGLGAAALLTCWAGANGSNFPSTGNEGDPAVKGDQANNRVLVNAPGVFEVQVVLHGTIDGTEEVTLQLRKNAVAIPTARSIRSWLVTINNEHTLHAIVQINQADMPKTIATMPAQASTTGPNNTPSFSGASGALLTECPLDLTVAAAGQTMTVVDASFIVKRIR